jgi:hypothetical protein
MSDITKKILLGVAYTVIVISVTRFVSPTKIKVETKTVTVEVASKETQSHSETVEEVKPDGTKKTTTVVDTNSTYTKNKDTNSETSKTEEYNKDSVTIQVLAGLDILHPTNGLVYGASISKPLIGPLIFGAWGLTNGTAGVSVGLKF